MNLLHFGATGTLTPYRHAGHYLGWTEDLDQRLARHHAGDGARLLAVVNQVGIEWTPAQTWPGTRARERRLKALGGHARICPLCRSIRAKGATNG